MKHVHRGGPLCRSLRPPAPRPTAKATEHLVEQAVDLAVGIVESAATPERAQTHLSYLLSDPLPLQVIPFHLLSMMPPPEARCELRRTPLLRLSEKGVSGSDSLL